MNIKCLAAVAVLAFLPIISTFAQAPSAANLSPAAAEVVRLAGAGTSEDVVLAFVQNSQAPFELSADHVLYLKDLGVPSPVVAAMLNHDAAMRSQAPAPVAEAPQPAAAPVPMGAPGPAQQPPPPAQPPVQLASSAPPVDVSYFYNDLAPYGTWADLPGFGWCWQPTVVASVGGWQPYCHGGHWANTDAGWFWASDYSWGWAPFHYGRWHHHPTAGWVWFPAREWAPAWVVWRSGGDACGWAPLPPHADFVAGFGWRYNGVGVSASFDFGLSVGCFSFVSVGHLCDANIHTYCLPPARVTAIYHTTTVINNYTVVNNTVVNHGINVTVVEKASGHTLERVAIHDYKGGAGGAGAVGIVRRPLGKPEPITHMTAVRVDDRGHIPLHVNSATMYSTTANGPKSLSAGNPNFKATTTSTKVTGPTHNFSAEKLDSKTTSTAGAGSANKYSNTGSQNTKFSTTAGAHPTSNFSQQNTGKSDANVHSTAGSSSASKFTSTSAAELNAKGNQNAGAGSSNPNLKQYNTKPTSSFSSSESEASTANKTLHAEDLRGANGLTPQGSKTMNYTTSGSSSKNTSGGASGSSTSHNQPNSSYQHSGGNSSSSSSVSKGASGAAANKENTGSNSGYNH